MVCGCCCLWIGPGSLAGWLAFNYFVFDPPGSLEFWYPED